MDALPDDVFRIVLEYMDTATLGIMCSTCTYFSNTISALSLWKTRLTSLLSAKQKSVDKMVSHTARMMNKSYIINKSRLARESSPMQLYAHVSRKIRTTEWTSLAQQMMSRTSFLGIKDTFPKNDKLCLAWMRKWNILKFALAWTTDDDRLREKLWYFGVSSRHASHV
jgi:hypothetical protein